MIADVLLPALLATAAILVVAGCAKLTQPSAAATFLRTFGVPEANVVVRVGALLEIAAGVAALHWTREAGMAIALLFAVFALVVAAQLRRQGDVPCGCLGAREIPPSRVHLALNLACAVAGLAAALAPPPALTSLVETDPASAIVAAFAAVVTALLAQSALVLLPPTLGAWSGARG